jgi:hypothetical protein
VKVFYRRERGLALGSTPFPIKLSLFSIDILWLPATEAEIRVRSKVYV